MIQRLVELINTQRVHPDGVHPDGVHPDGVHPDGVKKGDPACEALGQSVDGWTTKIYAVVDALGNPLRIILSPGQCADIAQAADLIADYPPKAFLADRGYDADRLLDELSSTNIRVVRLKRTALSNGIWMRMYIKIAIR